MTGPGADAFVRPLTIDDDEIGGKARSLARLAAAGLPTPPGFAVGVALFRRLRADGPALPTRLATAADLARLDAARAALLTASFPEGFADELGAALDALGAGTFAVRSSVSNEDRSGTLGAGIYLSVLRVPRSGVADAVRRVLGSSLTPAAWVYAARNTAENPSGEARVPDVSVLIHPFVDGNAAGVAATGPANGTAGPGADGMAWDVRADVRIDVQYGEINPATRAGIDSAIRAAAARHGAMEIEWVVRDNTLTFLQLRTYQPVPGHAVGSMGVTGPAREPPAAEPVSAVPPDDGWTWDAAHNPLPLSPAQAGLVDLVDATCSVGFRQRVVGGYLFVRRPDDPAPAPTGDSAREAFDRLTSDIEPRLAALGPEPSLATALDVFVAAYQPLFGVVGPACIAARESLTDHLTRGLSDRASGLPGLPELLLGIPSAATRRRAAAHAIVRASNVEARQMAIDEYLRQFGDESPRWDVAEPTLRETPELLLRLAARAPAPPSESMTGTPPTRDPQVPFDELVAAARQAAAVAEDDDALYARLQAGVRRALLGIGRRLHAASRLVTVDDVFFLPFPLVRAIEGSNVAAGADSRFAPDGDLKAIVAAAREAFAAAVAVPPPLARIDSPIARIVRGLAGASGRIVGRAVHHPASTPTGPDTVLIASTLLPTELPLLAPGAIVIETGSVLGHVAAQARERGIPAVVGAAGARAAIRQGALVVVDGDRGEVVCLEQGKGQA